MKAQTITYLKRGTNYVLLASFQNEKIYYLKTKKTTTSEGVTEIVISSLTVPSEELAAFNVAVLAKQDVNASISRMNRSVPTSLTDSAWDLVGKGYLQSAVASEFKTNQTLQTEVAHYLALVPAVLGKVVNVNLVVELDFSDGSTALFKIDGIDSDGDLTFSFLIGKDKDGNKIEDKKSNFVGAFNFSTGGDSAFRAAAGMYGFTFTGSISTSHGGGWICDQANLSCSVIIND